MCKSPFKSVKKHILTASNTVQALIDRSNPVSCFLESLYNRTDSFEQTLEFKESMNLLH